MKLTSSVLLLLLALSPLSGNAQAEINKLTVNKAWQRISKADGFAKTPIFFEKDLEPNAWAEFDGENKYTVHVTKGLMKILANEDEIAGLLGHELGHIRLGHYNGMLVSDNSTTVVGINTDSEYDSSFSRHQETDADNYGTALLRKARYKPRGLYDAIIKFEAHSSNSHPSCSERLVNLAEKAGITPGVQDRTLIGMEDIANILLGRK